MPRQQRLTWTVVIRLAVVVTFPAWLFLVVAARFGSQNGDGPTALCAPGVTRCGALSTITTVGYGDHVPVTTTGRLIAAGVMVMGVAIIGAVAAIVALAVALRVAFQEERAFEAEAETLEQRLEVRLARVEEKLADLDARLQTWSPASVNDAVRSGRDEQ